jgi:hypothetical protein
MGILQNFTGQVSNIDLKIAQYFPEKKLNLLYRSLDNNAEFSGAGVTFITYKTGLSLNSIDPLFPKPLVTFKSLRPSCRRDGKVVYIREITLPTNSPSVEIIQRAKSTLGGELTGAALSCTSAAIGWVLVIAEAGGGAATIGATWAAMPLTLSATSASTFQCGAAIGRTINIVNGNSDYNQWLNDSPTFSALMMALDFIQIADVVKTLGKQAELYRILKNKGIRSGNVLKMFKQMPRAARKRLAEEILKLDDPALNASKKILKQVLNGTKLLDDGSKAIKVYSQVQVQRLMTTKFLEILGSGVTLKGSGQGAYNGTKNTVGFIIGFGHN